MYQMGAPALRVRPLLAHGTHPCGQSNIYLAEPKSGYTLPKRSRDLYLSLNFETGISRPITLVLDCRGVSRRGSPVSPNAVSRPTRE